MALRMCDGSDEYLIARDGSGWCPCGLVFDDAERSVIWPHGLLLTRAQLQAIADALARKETR